MHAPGAGAVITDETQAGKDGGWWRWIVGLALLALVITLAGPWELLALLRRTSPAWMIVVAAVSVAWLVLGAVNVWLLLRRLAPVSLRALLPAYLTSWSLSLLVPGQLGDVTQIVLLRRIGIPVAASGAAYLLDKAISLAWLGLVAAIGVVLYAPGQAAHWLLAFGVIVSASIVGALVLSRLAQRSSGLVGRFLRVARQAFVQIGWFGRYPWVVGLNLTLTILKWALTTTLYLAAFRAVGASIPVIAAATIPFTSSLIGYVPITVGGAGTTELTAVLLFHQLGVTAATVVSVYLLVRGVLILTALLLLILARRQLPARAAP